MAPTSLSSAESDGLGSGRPGLSQHDSYGRKVPQWEAAEVERWDSTSEKTLMMKSSTWSLGLPKSKSWNSWLIKSSSFGSGIGGPSGVGMLTLYTNFACAPY
jgi:hypothetical protein